MQGFKKKILSLKNNGIDPLMEGYLNFTNPIEEVELLAIERYKACSTCDYLIDEPCGFLKVKDNRIPFLSKKMCDLCGCTSSYKLRQSIIKCEKWQD